MGKLPIKRTKKLAEAERTGELKAEEKYYSKLFSNKKQTQIWLAKQLERLIEKLDPIKLVAIVGTTLLVKNGVDWGTEFLAGGYDKNSLLRSIIRLYPFVSLLEGFIPDIPEEVLKEATDSPQFEILEWLISFIVAYMIVEHPEVIIALGGNILGVAKGLIGGLLG